MRLIRHKFTAAFLFVFVLLASSFSVFCQEVGPLDKNHDKKAITNPPNYKLLFIRHDLRSWIEVPPNTSLVVIRSSTTGRRGWVTAYNTNRQPLAIDTSFHGEAVMSVRSARAVFPSQFVVTMENENSIGIFTPPGARYIEILNQENGFDGQVFVYGDNRKTVLARQTGLDIRVTEW